MDRSPGFGSTTTDSNALFRLAFATAPDPQALNLARDSKSPAHSTKGTRSARFNTIGLSRLVSTRFQVLFHSPPGVLFTLSLTVLLTIGRKVIFSLGRWSSQIPTGFLVSRGTQVPITEVCALSPTRLSLHLACLSMQLRLEHRFLTPGRPCRTTKMGPTTPDEQRRQPITSIQFRLVPVRSPLLGESRLISFPPATEMFHFAGLSTHDYVFIVRSRSFITWWLPHSDIPGSTLARSSPRLFAACHVLLRRLPPRHPPRALIHFNPGSASRNTSTSTWLAPGPGTRAPHTKHGVRISKFPRRNCFRFL